MKKLFDIFNRNKFVIFFCALILIISACEKEEIKIVQFDIDGNPILEEQLILDESRLFLNYIIPEEKYEEFLEDDIDFTMVSNKIYTYLKDDFDFMFILADEDERPEGAAYGRTLPVSGDVEGLLILEMENILVSSVEKMVLA